MVHSCPWSRLIKVDMGLSSRTWKNQSSRGDRRTFWWPLPHSVAPIPSYINQFNLSFSNKFACVTLHKGNQAPCDFQPTRCDLWFGSPDMSLWVTGKKNNEIRKWTWRKQETNKKSDSCSKPGAYITHNSPQPVSDITRGRFTEVHTASAWRTTALISRLLPKTCKNTLNCQIEVTLYVDY